MEIFHVLRDVTFYLRFWIQKHHFSSHWSILGPIFLRETLLQKQSRTHQASTWVWTDPHSIVGSDDIWEHSQLVLGGYKKKQKMFKITIWKRLTLSDSKIGSKSCKMFVKFVKKLFHAFLLALPDPDSLFLFSLLIWHSWNQTLRRKWWKCKSKRKALLFFPKQGGEWWWDLGWRHIPLLLLVLVNSLLKDLYSSTRLWHHLALSWLMEVNKSKIKPPQKYKICKRIVNFYFHSQTM